jgi:hypothetical protein
MIDGGTTDRTASLDLAAEVQDKVALISKLEDQLKKKGAEIIYQEVVKEVEVPVIKEVEVEVIKEVEVEKIVTQIEYREVEVIKDVEVEVEKIVTQIEYREVEVIKEVEVEVIREVFKSPVKEATMVSANDKKPKKAALHSAASLPATSLTASATSGGSIRTVGKDICSTLI